MGVDIDFLVKRTHDDWRHQDWYYEEFVDKLNGLDSCTVPAAYPNEDWYTVINDIPRLSKAIEWGEVWLYADSREDLGIIDDVLDVASRKRFKQLCRRFGNENVKVVINW